MGSQHAGSPAEPSRGWGLLLAPVVAVVATLVVALFAVALFAVVLVGTDDDGSSPAGGGVPLVLDVELGDLYVVPSSVEVPAGTELIVNVTNVGAMPHDLVLEGVTGTAVLDPGESEQVSFGVVERATEAWCTVPGHREAGMVLDIVVTGSYADPSGGDHTGTAAPPTTAPPSTGTQPPAPTGSPTTRASSPPPVAPTTGSPSR